MQHQAKGLSSSQHFVLDATWSSRHRHVPNILASPWKDNVLQDRLHKFHQTLLAPQARRGSCPLCYRIGPTIAPGPDVVSFLGVPVCARERDRRETQPGRETIAAQYEGKLEKKYETRTYEVVSTLFKALTGRRVTIPSEFFKCDHNHSAIKCSMKANESVFTPKTSRSIHPKVHGGWVTYLLVWEKAASASRTFDLKFNMKSGVDYSFSSINREEYANLNEFLQVKNQDQVDRGRIFGTLR